MAAPLDRQGIERDPKTGEYFLPATQRPDGTWRKPRKVKEGYVPQEEVPVYENRGVSWKKSISNLPPGLAPTDAPANNETTSLSKNAKKKQKRKEKKLQESSIKSKASDDSVDALASAMANAHMDIGVIPADSQTTHNAGVGGDADIQKKLRGLRKKLKEVDNLKAKIDSGEIANPEKNQLDKLSKRDKFLSEIEELELQVDK